MTRRSYKFRAWESDAVHDTLEKVLWQKEKIKQMCIERGVMPEQLPHFAVNPDEYFELLVSFETLIDSLVGYELLLAGHRKQNFTIH